MKSSSIARFGFAGLLLATSSAHAAGWELIPAAPAHGLELTFSSDVKLVYEFECRASEISATDFGVTDLLDIQTGKKIEDTPGAVMTSGASVMALFTGEGEPEFVPAEAVPNAVKGWDLTIRFSKSDKKIRLLGRADMISLFTTGITQAVEMDTNDKALARSFLTQCGQISPTRN